MQRDTYDEAGLSSGDSIIDTFCDSSTANNLCTFLNSESEFAEFYSQQTTTLMKMASSLLFRMKVEGILPEDLVAEALATLWQTRKKFRGECQPTTYLYKLMVRALSARFKKESKETSASVSKPRNYRGGSDILDNLVAEKLNQMPRDCRYKLLIVYRRICFKAEITSTQADIVNLKRDGNTFEQIAQKLGLSKATVSRQYAAFRNVVRKGVIYEQGRFSDKFPELHNDIIRKEQSH